MSDFPAGTSIVANRSIRLNKSGNDPTHRQLILQIQSLLTLLGSLPTETHPDPVGVESPDFEVYGDDTYRYVSLNLPVDSGHEIDLNIKGRHVFARMAL